MQLFLDACDDGDPSGFVRLHDFNSHSIVFSPTSRGFSTLLLCQLPLKCSARARSCGGGRRAGLKKHECRSSKLLDEGLRPLASATRNYYHYITVIEEAFASLSAVPCLMSIVCDDVW